MSRLYKEYIKVESDFIPVFSASSDRTNPNKWLSFYPHESFKKILTSMIESLEKSSSTKDRSVWISGTYGTGKTYASFVVKHILEDDLKKVESYFEHNNLSSLWNRLSGIRSKGKILVINQSSSAGINSQNKLFNTFTDAVKRTLRENGYTYTGAASMYERVLQTLKDPDSTFNFQAAFRKYHGKFMEYGNVNQVIRDLETLDDPERMDLLEEIVSVAESESYNWSVSPQDLINWLRDIREKNNLYAIVFIWDEFTEYFKNNVNNITGLQEIAQASAELSFYFFLITHSDYAQLIPDEKQRRIIRERFKPEKIELPENTAFQLMGQALSIEPDLKDDWEKISLELFDDVKREAVNHIVGRDVTINQSNIKKLLPMHPYSSYLLKFISQDINSNQRTMFQFLCANSDEGNGNFKWFIENNSFDYGGWNFLTVDYLWDYFFKLDDPDLDKTFQEAIMYYNNFSEVCRNENQRRALKATLILFALQSKNVGSRTSGTTSLLRATLKNISACFAGTPFENEINPTMNFFVSKGIVTALEESGGTSYLMATTQVDSEQMEKLIEQVKREKTFDAIIKDDFYGVTKKFKPSLNYLKQRLDIQTISPTKFLLTSHENLKPSDNQILVFYLFAADETEQGKINQVIQKIYEKFPDRCIVADFSGIPFTSVRYEKFVQNKAKELYFKNVPNQREQMKLAERTATDIVQEWARQFSVANIRIYTSYENSVLISGEINFSRKLEELNLKFFTCGLETIAKTDSLFNPQGFKETVAKYALGMEKIPGAYSYLNNLENVFKEIGGREDGEYWKKNPSHTISKMKIIVENVIKESFEKKSAVRLIDIWQALKKSPVGLMKCVGSLYIFAALMKDYADNVYYIRDYNRNTHSLDGGRLANLLYGAVKELPHTDENSIVKQTPEHIMFCKVTGNIFNLAANEINSVDDVAKNIKIRLIHKNYPIWSLKYYAEEEYSGSDQLESILKFISLLDEFINSQTVATREKTKIADEIYQLYQKNSSVADEMKKIVRDDNFKSGMLFYIAQYKPPLTKITGKLKIDSAEYLNRLHEKLSSDSAYLWKVEDLNKQIDKLYLEFKLLDSLNKIFSEPQKNYFKARQELLEKLNRIKVPRAIVEKNFPDLKNIFEVFHAVCENSVKDFEQAANQIEIYAEQFKNFFDNQSEIFSRTVSQHFKNELDEKIIELLYRDIPGKTFFKTGENFFEQISRNLQTFRQNEKTRIFFETWQNVTGTKSPSDWSNKNKIPILCIFQDCLGAARTAFGALNKSFKITDEKLEEALKFIQSEKILRLKDKNFCEQEFVEYFGGENYSYVLGVENLRELLTKQLGDNVYSWYDKKNNCENQIKSTATNNYHKNFSGKAHEKVRELSAEQAKKYLEELIDKDPLLGIRILKNS